MPSFCLSCISSVNFSLLYNADSMASPDTMAGQPVDGKWEKAIPFHSMVLPVVLSRNRPDQSGCMETSGELGRVLATTRLHHCLCSSSSLPVSMTLVYLNWQGWITFVLLFRSAMNQVGFQFSGDCWIPERENIGSLKLSHTLVFHKEATWLIQLKKMHYHVCSEMPKFTL